MKLDISLISFEQLQLQPQKLLPSKKLRKQIGKNERGHKTEHLVVLEIPIEKMVIVEALEIFNGICNHCRNVKGIVVCHTCHALLCPECDSTFHFNHIAHDRVILQEAMYKLKSVQHVEMLGKVRNRGVIPVFITLIDTILVNI
jgi:hypothetical protein